MFTNLIVMIGLFAMQAGTPIGFMQPASVKRLPEIPAIFQTPWNTEGPEKDGKVAIRLAELSKDAYLDADEARRVFAERGFKFTHLVRFKSTVAYVVKVDDVCVVAFRGTNDIEDWFINLDFRKRPLDGHGAVHSGFYEAYQAIRNDIASLVKEGSPKHVWITGHSLGGALALNCAYDLIEHQNVAVTGVVTFGQPMFANDDFAAYLETRLRGKYARFVNGKDIVPNVPPTFTHCGSLFWFKDGTIKRNQPRPLYAAATMQERGTGGYSDLRPLSVPEFEAEKARLRAKKMASPQLVQGSVEGSSPYIAHHSMSLYLDLVMEHIGSANDKPIRFDQSVELPAVGGNSRIVAERGSVVELKINDPASPAMVSRLLVEDSGDVTYLGKRYKTDRAPDGGMMAGSGWTCLYFRVNQSERITIEYSKGNSRIRHEVTFRSRR